MVSLFNVQSYAGVVIIKQMQNLAVSLKGSIYLSQGTLSSKEPLKIKIVVVKVDYTEYWLAP